MSGVKGKSGKYLRTLQIRESLRNAQLGTKKPWAGKYKRSEEHKRKISEAKKGEKSNLWKGGITFLQKKIRNLFEYRLWRSDIFTGDDFICQDCGERGGRIVADHIKAFSLILEENKIKTLEEALSCKELWNINNGRTLCQKCHKKTENFGAKTRWRQID